MQRIVRLTESDLTRIVRRVISEQDDRCLKYWEPVENLITQNRMKIPVGCEGIQTNLQACAKGMMALYPKIKGLKEAYEKYNTCTQTGGFGMS